MSTRIGEQGIRFAQEYGGQKLHLVGIVDGGVAWTALCGRQPEKRGHWRMTINLPLGHACKRCWKIATKEVAESDGGEGTA